MRSPYKSFRTWMDFYCLRRNIDRRTIQFMHDGYPIDPSDTPHSLGMKSGAIIQVVPSEENTDNNSSDTIILDDDDNPGLEYDSYSDVYLPVYDPVYDGV